MLRITNIIIKKSQTHAYIDLVKYYRANYLSFLWPLQYFMHISQMVLNTQKTAPVEFRLNSTSSSLSGLLKPLVVRYSISRMGRGQMEHSHQILSLLSLNYQICHL